MGTVPPGGRGLDRGSAQHGPHRHAGSLLSVAFGWAVPGVPRGIRGGPETGESTG